MSHKDLLILKLTYENTVFNSQVNIVRSSFKSKHNKKKKNSVHFNNVEK
jgi:hypothetical protein